jgi:hypothetical protein
MGRRGTVPAARDYNTISQEVARLFRKTRPRNWHAYDYSTSSPEVPSGPVGTGTTPFWGVE